ncbi:MAG: signal peptidase I [Acidobacteria bacterium]|nr:signal peptidase I [Acidobacteriota bacterium]
MSSEISIQLEPNRKVKFNRKRLLLVILACILIPPAVSILVVLFVIQPVKNQSGGMSPTINDGDRILLSKRIGTLNRGDIIVFYFPLEPKLSYVKRIVGLPGEAIRIDEAGKVFINGSPIEEAYLHTEFYRHPRPVDEVLIKPDSYFVMGDNRDGSNDSRSWGQVPRSLIYGKYLWRYWAAN